MEINIFYDLPIKAEPIDNHYDLKHERYDVETIDMGQWSTSIKIIGFGDKTFNSIHFNFYLYNRKINIYRSGLINHYRTLSLPGICYDEGE